MRWLKHLFGRAAHTQFEIQFVGEQDGPVEREIKARWRSIFEATPLVRCAYLAVATYDQAATFQPVLCVAHARGQDVALVDTLSEPFREQFHRSQALDILFLRQEQEEQLRKVCRSFYDRA